jgi:hypothetical protein
MIRTSKLALVLLIFSWSPALPAQTKATTEDGREVILKDNGTWKFADEGDQSEGSGSETPSAKSAEDTESTGNVEVPELSGQKKLRAFLKEETLIANKKKFKRSLENYTQELATAYPMESLRSKTGACLKTALDPRLDITIVTCLKTGRPKTLSDDKKPRIQVLIRSSKIELAKVDNYQVTVSRNGTQVAETIMRGTNPEVSDGSFYSVYEKVLSRPFSPGDSFEFEYVAAYNTDLNRSQHIRLKTKEDWKDVQKTDLNPYIDGLTCEKKKVAPGTEYHLCAEDGKSRLHVFEICVDGLTMCSLWDQPGALSADGETIASWKMEHLVMDMSTEVKMPTSLRTADFAFHYMGFQTTTPVDSAALKLGKGYSSESYWPVTVRLSE